MNTIILKHVLKNAVDFQGKANPKAVLGQVLKELPNAKKDVPGLLREIDAAIKDIGKLSLDQMKKKLTEEFPDDFQEQKEEIVQGPLKPLPNAQYGMVITRIAPSPSGPLHIGHAYGAALNYEYAKMYGGRLILRIEDTNPENIYPDAYAMIEDDIRWITDNNVAEVMIQSSRLGIYYDHAEKIIQKEKAYVCLCDADNWRELKAQGKSCPCRKEGKKEHLLRYAKMFNGYAEGEAVLRLKTDIDHKNPAMRDFAIMRIAEQVHPKTGKDSRVWPLMVFSVAIDDHLSGVTHVLNGKEHADNSLKENMVRDALGWSHPIDRHWGKINFKGFKLKTSLTKLAIERGEYEGWDDIRLPFLAALRKRGYQAAAIRKFALEIGLSLNDKHVTMEEFWKLVNAFNKDLVEPAANRYFFVENPIPITVAGAPARDVQVNLHPDFPERGKRTFQVDDKFLIADKDFKSLGEDYLHRLMDCCNFKLQGKTFEYVSDSYDEYKNSQEKGRIIHWLPAKTKNTVNIKVLVENNTWMEGKGEKDIRQLNEGSIVQFERRFFTRLVEKREKNMIFWYLHK